MNMNKRWMALLILILGATMISGCYITHENMMAYNEAKELFQKATDAGAKKCAPVQYATAEAYLAWVEEEVAEKDNTGHGGLKRLIGVVKEKSLEALKLTPCEKPAPPPPPPPPAPPKPAPPKPAPPAPPPKPAPKRPPVFDSIYFDPNKTNITPIAAKALDRNAWVLKDNPDVKVEIGGHTDGVGAEKANQKLSEKRALSAKKYLQDKYNIPDNRLIIKSYGETKPVADNKTQEGRSKNRRVEFKVIP
jgi:outer membrane protein OmpA-like peptidoglycan-associated protein